MKIFRSLQNTGNSYIKQRVFLKRIFISKAFSLHCFPALCKQGQSYLFTEATKKKFSLSGLDLITVRLIMSLWNKRENRKCLRDVNLCAKNRRGAE